MTVDTVEMQRRYEGLKTTTVARIAPPHISSRGGAALADASRFVVTLTNKVHGAYYAMCFKELLQEEKLG